MQYSNSLAVIVAACIAIGAIGASATYHYVASSSPAGDISDPPISLPGNNAGNQNPPTPEYLITHPAALKAAEIQCQNSVGPNIVGMCDNVHSAQSDLLAAQYRDAAGKSQ